MVIRRFCPSNDFWRRASAAIVAALVIAQGCSREHAGRDGSAPADLRASEGKPKEADRVPVGEPSASDPVKAAMQIRPAATAPGASIDAIVYARIAPAHYLHAASALDTTFKPLSIELKLPDTLESSEDWQFPQPVKIHGDTLGYRESVTIRRSLRVPVDADPQTVTLSGKLRFQACTDELCWPPGEIALSAPLVIQSKAR
jgi:Thiol:disulfide interchange protein DsbD, N-terminal